MMILQKLSKRERSGLFIAIIVLSIVVCDRFVYSPVTAKIGALNEEISMLEKELTQNLKNLNRRTEIEKNFDKYKFFIRKLGSDEEEMAKILSDIESLSTAAGVYLSDIKPKELKDGKYYKEYSVYVEEEGAIDMLIRFIYKLQKSTDLLKLENIRLRRPERPEQQEAGIVKASLTVSKRMIVQ